MKKYLKLIIPATLLLIATSAFAQVNQEFDDFQKQSQEAFDSFSKDAKNQFNDFSKNAQAEFDDFTKQVNSTKQEQEKVKQEAEKRSKMNQEFAKEIPNNMQTYKAQEPISAPVRNKVASVCPENDFDCVCGNDKYCKTHAQLLQKVNIAWDQIINALKDKKGQKQALYKSKYVLTTPYADAQVIALEQKEIAKLSSFNEVKNYALDMPVKEETLKSVARKLDNYCQGTKEEKTFIKSFIKALDKSEACPYDLDVETFGLENFCFISRPDIFKFDANVAIHILETTLKK